MAGTASELLVISPIRDWACSSCGGTGELLIMDDPGPVCLQCAELDHLVFLPSGDAALRRRARRGSDLSAVVVRFSRSRGRYERQGILVEEAALAKAETECLADESARARRDPRQRTRWTNGRRPCTQTPRARARGHRLDPPPGHPLRQPADVGHRPGASSGVRPRHSDRRPRRLADALKHAANTRPAAVRPFWTVRRPESFSPSG